MFEELLRRLRELLAVATDAATDDVERLIATAAVQRHDMIERALTNLQANVTVLTFWLILLDDQQVLGPDSSMDAQACGFLVVGGGEPDEASPFSALCHRSSEDTSEEMGG